MSGSWRRELVHPCGGGCRLHSSLPASIYLPGFLNGTLIAALGSMSWFGYDQVSFLYCQHVAID
jgi:hypothetical protein